MDIDPATALRLAGQDNGPLIVGVTWFLCAFSGVFLGLRLYAKASRRQGLWWDDYILVFSWILLLVESILLQIGRGLGLGKHVWTFKPEDAFILLRGMYIGATISCFAATFSKISFGVTLLRLFKGKLYAFVWLCIGGLFLTMLPSAFLSYFSCRPLAKLFDPFLDGTCWPGSVTRDYGYFNAAFCAIIDFALALLPWQLLWGLQLKTKEKIGVGIAMSMGLLAGICAIVKGFYLQQVTDPDFFYAGKDVLIWTAVESAAAIVGASVPVLRVFFKDTMSSLHDRYQRTNDESTYARSNTLRGSTVPLSHINGNKSSATRSSIRSVQEIIPGNGTPMHNGGILQTSSVSVESAEYLEDEHGRIIEHRR